MTSATGNRGFVRTRISTVERAISAGLILALGAIGTAIYQSGQSYDAALFGLDPEALAAPVTGKLPANTIVVASPTRAAMAASGPVAWLEQIQPDGWARSGAVESFDAADLYVKINGRAEQYLAYDVVGLDCASFTDASAEGRFIDVFLYEMGTPGRAFGIYAVELDPEAPPVDLGRGGYRSGSSLFFWQGGFYLQILASETSDAMTRAADAIAADLIARVPDHGKPVPGMNALPTAGQIRGSLQYMVRNGLSLPFLTETWTADYRIEDHRVTLFLSVQSSTEAVEQVLEGYRGYLNDFGATITESTDGGATALFGDMDGYYDVVRSKGHRVAGAVLLEDPQLARQIAADWLPGMVADQPIDPSDAGDANE